MSQVTWIDCLKRIIIMLGELWMQLFANKYGIVTSLTVAITICLFILSVILSCIIASKIPAIGILFFVSICFIFCGLNFAEPQYVPKFGTQIQKTNMIRCVNQYKKNNLIVNNDSITDNNILSIMQQCTEQDENNKSLQKTKQFQDALQKLMS